MRGDVGTLNPTHRSSLCNIGADFGCIRNMEADVQHGMVFLPPTSDFPPDPEPLEREVRNSTYLEMRNCYSCLMRSRAQHQRLANKAKDETALLKERITALASRDLPQRQELYELLEIVTALAGDIEDAGDDLVNGFSRYKKSRHTFRGGGYLGDLMHAVIHFVNRWGCTKDRLGDLKQKQQELINKSKDLLPPPPPPGGNGNGHGPAAGTPTPPPGSPPQPIDVNMNRSQPEQPAEPTGPQAQRPHQQPPQPQPQPQDQAKGADQNG